jgi:protein associated with RNAse G/E
MRVMVDESKSEGDLARQWTETKMMGSRTL